MSAPMGVVLTATAVVSSPSLWLLHNGTLSGDEALKRVLICLALCWGALSLVAAVAFPGPAVRRAEVVAPDDPDPGADPVDGPVRPA